MELINEPLINYPWLMKAYQNLTLPLINGHAHHALLIKYIAGCGEEKVVTKLAMRLLCSTPQKNEPCGQCHHCQLFLANNNPDYYIIKPEKNKLSIGIDQIRGIATKIYERSQQGGNKVVWLQTASLMTEAAANALLKTLEEPPENTYFLLSDIDNGKLLPTIRSRCQFYFLPVPELDASISWLKSQSLTNQYNENQLATALLLNNNAPLAALKLLETEQWQQREQFTSKLQIALTEYDFWSLRDSFLNQENSLIRLNWFCILLNDSLKARQKSGRFIANRDQVALVRVIAHFGTEKIIKLYTLWRDVQEQLATVTALNQDLIISNLLAQSEIIINSSTN
ncbi:DNA polymerase III subunit delta' [Orbus sturtevantii]|uniref:DNA polymerase III subunit delta' n=1 Tax=Orbus sturtevantii TaxID=3074109 RepID=UPI00370D02A4